jgi:hypothetical protein
MPRLGGRRQRLLALERDVARRSSPAAPSTRLPRARCPLVTLWLDERGA